MDLPRAQLTVTDRQGNIVDGATVSVTSEATGSPATVYSDRGGLSSLGSSYVAADGSNAGFFAPNGEYRIDVEKDGDALTEPKRYVRVGGGADGTITFNGTTVPSDALGRDGDYYLRTTTSDLYFKAAGTWSILVNLHGADGNFSGTVVVKTANYEFVAADSGKIFEFDSASPLTAAFDAVASLGTTFQVVINVVGDGTLTLDPDGAETINDAATLDIESGQGAYSYKSGSGLRALVWGQATDPGGGGASDEQIDALFFDQRLQGLILAESVGDVLFFGPDGSALHDGFDVLDYVDIAGAANIDSSTPGELKTQTAVGADTDTAAATNVSNDLSGGTVVNRAFAVRNSRRLTDIGLDSTTARTYTIKLVKRLSASNYDIVVSETFVHGGTGLEYHTLSSAFDVPSTGTYFCAFYYASGNVNATSSTARGANGANSTGLNQGGFSDSTGGAPRFAAKYAAVSPGDVDVKSFAVTAGEEPDAMRAVVRIRDADGLTLNTDFFVKFSRDGGTTWSTATVIERFLQAGNIRVLDTQNVDVSGQPSDTDMKWRIQSDNGVEFDVLGIAMWGVPPT